MTASFKTRSRHYFAYLLLLIIFLTGEGLFIFGIDILKLDKAPGRWVKTTGVVKRSLLTYDGQVYDVDLLYTFTVNGVTNSGHRVTFCDYGRLTPSNAVNIVKQYPKGAEVIVNYRLNDPSVCVLTREETRTPWCALTLGAALMGVALFGIVRENRR